uniref:FtsK domain-containing protein n=1 Tax=Thermosporothrix sp. COM3 TaxID=2490863 RepID=A0A455SMQ3_9CHLR|nr:hypothetical protein KTC_44080 [Thermosporothrix sp. COM3]
MAGGKKKKDDERQKGLGPSRVSGAAGALGSHRLMKARVEQRSSISSTSRPSGRKQAAQQQTQRTKSASRASTGKKKAASARTAVPPVAEKQGPQDTRFIDWIRQQWETLDSYQQQRVFGVLLLILSLLLFGSLTIFSTSPVFSAIKAFFIGLLGWTAYLFALGLIAFSTIHLVEGVRRTRLMRWPMVVGSIVLLLILLVESRLWLGQGKAGSLADALALPFLGWDALIAHVILIGAFLLVFIFSFRITFGHVLSTYRSLRGLFGRHAEESTGQQSSPFLGQRPRFSRYMRQQSEPDDIGDEDDDSQEPLILSHSGKQLDLAEMEDLADDETVDLHSDMPFEEEDEDPLNDINLHKQHIGSVPKGPMRVPPSFDPHDYAASVDSVSQQPLPFEQKGRKAPPRRKVKLEAPQAIVADEDGTPSNPRLQTPANQRGSRRERAAQTPSIVSRWRVPDTSLLNSAESAKLQMYNDNTAELARLIQETLRSFRVEAEVRPEDISIGPTVIRFGIRPTGKPALIKDDKTGKMIPMRDAAGNIIYETRTRVSRIMALQNDLALVLEAKSIRMEAPVPGRPYVGVEIPNKNSRLVTLREVLESREYQAAKNKSKLTVALGKDVAGQVRFGDLARMPHLLIAGATGAGKSVMINTLIASLLTQGTPDDVRLLMVDPKMVELSLYSGIPHLLSPVVTEVEKVVPLLRNAISEMERRYRLFSQLGVRNLDGYRKMRLQRLAKGDTSLNNLPAIVIIIDELADLMMAAPEEVESMICRLAQLARATGIHLVIATQRPSVDVITGLIKANIPTRISFMVSSAVDSRTIIDMGGAERLLGRGDMLYLPADAGRPERIQACFLADEEAERLVQFWRDQAAELAHSDAVNDPGIASALQEVAPGWEIQEQQESGFELEDELLDKAEEVVREEGRASISLLQRRLRVGYSRAARLIDLLEQHGVIGQFEPGGRSRMVFDSQGGIVADDAESEQSLSDAAEEIAFEEQARNEWLRQQAKAQRQRRPQE